MPDHPGTVGTNVTIRVRRIEPDDAERLCRLRLAALADAPGSFWQTLDAESARPLTDWQTRAARNATGDDHATFVLTRPAAPRPLLDRRPGPASGLRGEHAEGALVEELVGMVDVLRPLRAPEFRELAAMWVAPAVRGSGAAGLLLGAALHWARTVGAIGVRLWVVPTNAAAVGIYLRHGFRPLGAVEDAEPDESGKVYLPMLLALDDSAATSPTFLEQAQAPWTDESG